AQRWGFGTAGFMICAPRHEGERQRICCSDALALLQAPQTDAQKKTAHASEQDRPDVLKRRQDWLEGQLDLDSERLVFIDETWTSTNMARTCAGSGRAPASPLDSRRLLPMTSTNAGQLASARGSARRLGPTASGLVSSENYVKILLHTQWQHGGNWTHLR